MGIEALTREKNRLLSENIRLHHSLDQAEAAIVELLHTVRRFHAEAKNAQAIAREAVALATQNQTH
jgi:hypothetical protein